MISYGAVVEEPAEEVHRPPAAAAAAAEGPWAAAATVVDPAVVAEQMGASCPYWTWHLCWCKRTRMSGMMDG